MPEETKGPTPVSPSPGSEKPSAEKAEAPVESSPPASSTPAAKPDAPQPAASGAPPATGDKPAAAAKPAAPGAETPAAAKAPVPGDKPAPAAPAKPAAPAAAKPAPKPEGPKPEPWESELVTRLRRQYGSGITEASTYVGQKYLVVDSAILYEILLLMRDDEHFDYCVDITAVHYPKREAAQFDIVYVLYSFHQNQRVRVKTQIKENDSLRTAVGIWETANWLEREVYDMFGIVFDGHPDLKRILLPDGWKGYPLRKDYPILQQDQEWVQINLGIESGQ